MAGKICVVTQETDPALSCKNCKPAVTKSLPLPIGKGNDFVTAGLQFLQDKAGSVSWVTTHILPAINYHKALSGDRSKYLSLGFMGGWVQQHFDRSKMTRSEERR